MKKYVVTLIVAILAAGCAAPAREAAVTPKVSAAEKPAARASTAPKVDAEALSYLDEVALSGFEFGSAPHVVYKWTHDIEVSVSGSLGDSDKSAVRTVIADLNELIAPLQVRQVASGGDITIWYGEDSEFSRRLPGYTPGNRGYFQVKYGMDYSLHASSILISTEVNAAARAHLVREELTQSLGFFSDSWTEEASIFYQGWTTISRYSEQDKAIIRMLYDSRIKPGMTPARVHSILGA